MQQTRIEQGVPYYDRFVNVFPTVHDLAEASEEEVLKLWQGLGYYARARNLHSTANEVVEKYGGRFPDTYEDLRALKGVGDYTAAAIASVCFGLSRPVMDGNVIRFVTRYFGITGPVDQTGTKKEISGVLNELMKWQEERSKEVRQEIRKTKRDTRSFSRSSSRTLSRSSSRSSLHSSGTFNQAMIEFGATYCVPRNPNCTGCIFNSSCYALKHRKVNILPLKKQPQPLKPRYFHYFAVRIRKKQGLYFRRRSENDIWRGLYEFPLIETSRAMTLPGLMKSPGWKQFAGRTPLKVLNQTSAISHMLSHQKIIVTFYSVEIEEPSEKFGNFVTKNKIHELPVAKVIERYLEHHG